MNYISATISGVPYAKQKSRGDTGAPERWSDAVRTQTRHLPRVREACIVKVTLLLPPDKFPTDFPYGPGLDNLLKRFMDALSETVFSEAHGGDSCVLSISVAKARVASPSLAGAHIEIVPVGVKP